MGAALIAAGYQVYAVNPLQAARYRERHSVSGAKSDPATRTCWPTWCAPTPTSCARSPATARGRGGQGRHPGTQDADLGTHPPHAAAAARAAGVLPGRAGRLRRPDAPDALELLAMAPDPASAAS